MKLSLCFPWNPLIPFISPVLSVARRQACVVKPRLKLVHLSKWNVLYPCNNVYNVSFFIRPGLFCYWQCIGVVVLCPLYFPYVYLYEYLLFYWLACNISFVTSSFYILMAIIYIFKKK